MYKGISVYKSEVITDSAESIHREKFQLFFKDLLLKAVNLFPNSFRHPKLFFTLSKTGLSPGAKQPAFPKLILKIC